MADRPKAGRTGTERGGRYRSWLCGFAAAVTLFALPVEAATVPVRAANHKNFGRMVFDWPQRVGFTARVEGRKLIVAFEQSIEAPLHRAIATLPAYLTGGRVAADGKTVEFDLKGPMTVKSFYNRNSAVIDLSPAAATQVPKAEPAPARAPSGGTVTVRASDHPTHSRLSFDWRSNVGYTVKRDGSAVTVLFDRGARANMTEATRAALRNIRNVESYPQPNGALAVTFAAPAGAEVKDGTSGRSIFIDVMNADAVGSAPGQAAQAPIAQVAAAPSAPVAASAHSSNSASTANALANAAPAATASPAIAPAVAAKPEPARGPALVFDVGGPSSIAVFPRAGRLYVVFDKPLPIGAGRVVGAGGELLGAIEPVPATGGSAFRTNIGPMVWPRIERQGTSWRIVPAAGMPAAPQEIRIDAEPDYVLGARLMARAPDADAVVQLIDPEVGDRLQVVPLPTPGLSVPAPRRYADLEVMPSYQGMVVRPIADSVTVRPVTEGVELTITGGLRLSPMGDAGRAPIDSLLSRAPLPGGESALAMAPPMPIPTGRRLFDFAAWQRGGIENHTTARQDLQLAVVNAPESERPQALLDLARFYLAQGFGPETLGMLDVLQQGQPDLEGRPEFRALRGAARVLSGDLAGAAQDFGDPALAGSPETLLWKAAIAADQGDWPAAHDGFKATDTILGAYPEPLLGELTLRAAEAALEVKDTAFARRMLDRILMRAGAEEADRADLQYLHGLYHAQRGDAGQARELLQAAYDGLDRLYRAKAGLALTNLELAEKILSPAAAAERLGGLTVTWRGDDLEMKIRRRMGELLIEAGQYAEGFKTMKDTAALVADTPMAEAIAGDMTRIFGDLYRDGGSKLSTLDALQLYDQFRELTPVGEAGDEIIRQLAERLIEVDLLNRAADLLQHQVEYRLSGQDKARVGTRLASVRLLDNKPEEAIRALELSNVPDMPADLAVERRLMQAKALAELGRGEEALLLLAADESQAANLLRVDIAWRAQKWEPAAFALGKIIGPPPPPGQPLDAGR
jgi:hypothetical protein